MKVGRYKKKKVHNVGKEPHSMDLARVPGDVAVSEPAMSRFGLAGAETLARSPAKAFVYPRRQNDVLRVETVDFS